MGKRHPGGRRSTAKTQAVLAEYGRTCHLCLRPGATTRDHIVPLSRGGLDTLANCRPAHHRCNSKRGARPITAELLAEFRVQIDAIAHDPASFFEDRTPWQPRDLRPFSPQVPDQNGDHARSARR